MYPLGNKGEKYLYYTRLEQQKERKVTPSDDKIV